MDLILKPLCQHVPSFIRDDMDFLNYLSDEVEEHTLLVSFLMTFSKEFILEAISLVLKENTFSFDNKHYRQLQGTAMGTMMAPTYATLVIGYLEANLYRKYKETFGKIETEEFIKIFKRFLDDCFLF